MMMLRGREVLDYDEGYTYCRDRDMGIDFLAYTSLLMCDWDLPNPGHKSERCLTITHRDEAIEQLASVCALQPDLTWRVYDTPGGVRAFLTSHLTRVNAVALGIMRLLNCDPVYTMLTRRERRWWCRVSPKPDREGDYVAQYREMVKGVEGIELLDALLLLTKHDRLVRRFAS